MIFVETPTCGATRSTICVCFRRCFHNLVSLCFSSGVFVFSTASPPRRVSRAAAPPPRALIHHHHRHHTRLIGLCLLCVLFRHGSASLLWLVGRSSRHHHLLVCLCHWQQPGPGHRYGCIGRVRHEPFRRTRVRRGAAHGAAVLRADSPLHLLGYVWSHGGSS
jgi:hypothetical protein